MTTSAMAPTVPPSLEPAQALAMCRARALMRGIDASDFDRVSAAITDWNSWWTEWSALGAHWEELAARYESSGWAHSAGQAGVRAGLAYHFAKLFAVCDEEIYRETTLRCVAACRKGLELLPESFERIEVPFGGHYIVGHLRKPLGAERPPLVLLVPGLESVKEEFPRWEDEFLARGMATLSMDGPGQGEVGFELRIRPDYEAPVQAMLDALSGREDIDLARIGGVGMSMGGYYVTRAAAFEPRIKAVATNGGTRNLGADWDKGFIPPMYTAKFIWNLGASSPEEGREKAHKLDLTDVLEGIKVPLLVIYGEKDPLVDIDLDGHGIVDAVGGELWVFPGGNHGVTNFAQEHLGPAADWLHSKLA
jgi:2,6-dihydroxypseudooxynicotine hydrolase